MSSNRKWFSRVNRRRQKAPEPLTEELATVSLRDSAVSRPSSSADNNTPPTTAETQSTRRATTAAVVEEDEGLPGMLSTQPPALTGASVGVDALPPPSPPRTREQNPNRNSLHRYVTQDVLATTDGRAVEESSTDFYRPPPPPRPSTPPGSRPYLGGSSNSFAPPRETSSLDDMATAKMAAYQASGRGNGGATMIPIAPGVSARLRGANETWDCIERDFYLPVTCFACSLEMCCIQDADYVICPLCKVVSPLDTGVSPHVANDFRGQREQTVGLGFTYEDLCKWQSEIIQRRMGPTV